MGKKNVKVYHIPTEANAGPQSQENEACIFLSRLA